MWIMLKDPAVHLGVPKNMFSLSFLICLGYILSKGFSHSINLKYDKATLINGHLENLANYIVYHYFNKNRCLIVLSDKNFLNTIRTQNTVIHLQIDSENIDCPENIVQFFKETFKDNCDGYIVQLKDPTCAIKDFITYGDKLLSLPATDISANILISELYESDQDWKVVISTNNFYLHPSQPRREATIFLDEWQYISGFRLKADLYPDKLKDLRGKNFRIATGKYMPYSSAELLDGSEVRLGLLFCEKHNCTAVAVADDFWWGTIYENHTGNGALGNVYVDLADIGVMAVYLWLEESYYIDYSSSWLRGEVTVMTPRPTRLSGWITPFLPYSSVMWIAFIMSLVLSSLSLYAITKAAIKYTRFREELLKNGQFSTLTDSSLRAIGLAVLQQPSSRLIGDSPNRYLFTSFEFLYLVLSAMYSAELASFLTVPLYHAPIDRFNDFAKSNMLWLGQHEAFTYALQASPDEEAKTIVNNFRLLPMEDLKKRAKEGKHALLVERLPGGSTVEQDHETEEVIPLYHIMKDYLFGSPLVASIKKGSPYLKHFNRLVNMAVEHGHYLHFEAEVSRMYLNSRIQAEFQAAKSMHMDAAPAVLELSHIKGVILIFVIGVFASCIVFFAEILPREIFLKSNLLRLITLKSLSPELPNRMHAWEEATVDVNNHMKIA